MSEVGSSPDDLATPWFGLRIAITGHSEVDLGKAAFLTVVLLITRVGDP